MSRNSSSKALSKLELVVLAALHTEAYGRLAPLLRTSCYCARLLSQLQLCHLTVCVLVTQLQNQTKPTVQRATSFHYAMVSGAY